MCTDVSKVTIDVLDGHLVEGLFKSEPGQIRILEDRLVVSFGRVSAYVMPELIAQADKRNYHIYYSEIDHFGFTVKNSEEILLKLEANGRKTTFLIQGNTNQEEILKRLQTCISSTHIP